MNDVTLKIAGIKIDPTQAKQGLKETRDSLDKTHQSGDRLSRLFRNIFVGFSASVAIRNIVDIGDEMKTLDARIALVTDGQNEFNTAQERTLGIALETHTALNTTVDLYTRLERALDGQNKAQNDVLQVTKTINQALAVSGATAAETSSVITQLSQGFAAGALRGEEFNSVSESGSRIMQVLKDELGKTSGELREMAKQGELTTDIIFDALKNQSDAINEEFTQLPVTVDKAMTDISTRFKKYIADVDDSVGITDKFSKALQFIGENLDEILDVMGELLKLVAIVAGAKGIGLLISGFTSLSAVVAATTIKVVGLGQALKAAVITNPIGAALVAGYAAFEGVNALIDSHNDRITRMAALTGDAKKAKENLDAQMAKGFDTSGLDTYTESVQTLETELIRVKDRLQEINDQIQSTQTYSYKEGAFFDTRETTGLRDEKEALELREKNIKTTLGLASAQKFLTDTFGPLYQAVLDKKKADEDAAAAAAKLKKETQEAEKSLKKLVKPLKDRNALLKAEIAVLQGNANALNEFNKVQAVALGQTKEEKEAIAALFDEYLRLQKLKDEEIQKQNELNDAQLIWNQLMIDAESASNPYFEAEQKRLTQREALQLLYDQELITFDQYVAGQQAITRQFNNEADAVRNLGKELKQTETLFGAFFKGFEDGFKGLLSNVKQAFKDNPLESTAQFSSILPGILDSIEGNDSSARALNEIASQIPIPEVQAVAAILDTIDQLFGGKLLGTNYQTVGSGFNVDFGAGGVSGNQFERQERERSFFRGTRRRIRESELDAAVLSGFEDTQSQAEQLAQDAARLLGVEYIGTINASLEQEVDKNGNLIKSVITAFGREIEGGAEDLQRYLFGGSIFDQIAQVGPEVAAAVFQIQEAYIGNSERFLEAAQATLLAQTDINNGFNILVNGSLSDIINLTEDYNRAGETLVDTYSRVTASFKILEEAVGIMGLSIDMTRQQAIEFAVGMSDAAGGTDQLLRLTQGYFSNFYSEQELYIQQLQGVNDEVSRLNAELGTDLNFDNFRQEFENALPELTPSEVVQWLRLGNYLAEANDLAGRLADSSLNDAIAEYMGMADALTEANYTLGDQLNNSAEAIKEMIAAYDGSIDAENRIAESLRSRYEMELAFIDQIRSASESITQLIAGAREDVFLTGLTDEEQYNYFRGEAESAAAAALLSNNPEEIERLTQRALDYERRAFGLLDEGQQDELRDGFLSFIDELGEGATARLTELEQAAAEQSQQLLDSLGTMLNANAEAARQSNEQFATSVETFAQATVRLDQAVTRLQQIQVVVDVRREDAFETQGGY